MAPRKTVYLLVVCAALLLVTISVQAAAAPYVNPLGGLEQYLSVGFIPLSSQVEPWIFSYSAGGEYQALELWGNTWTLLVPEDSLAGLMSYLDRLNSTCLTSSNDFVIAQVQGPSGDWWVRADYWGDNQYELTVVEEQDPLEQFSGDDYEDMEFVPPLINPLQDLETYSLLQYWPADHFENRYYNSQGEAAYLRGRGETWQFYVPIEDPDNPWQELEEHVLGLGGTVLERSRHMFRAAVVDPNSYLWEVVAQLEPDEWEYALRIAKELLVRPNRSVTIRPRPDLENTSIVTISDGLRHKSLIIELSDSEFYIQATLIGDYGDYTRRWDESFQLYHERTPIYVLDNIPQEPGKTVWNLRFDWAAPPQEIKITLKESIPLHPLSIGSELGVLKVSGFRTEDIRIEPSFGMTARHPDYERPIADKTPEGDSLFYLPAGYWDVFEHRSGYQLVRARLIPVSSGQITIFSLPEETHAIYEELPSDEIPNSYGLSNHTVQGELGTVDFTLTPITAELIPSLENAQITEGGLKGEIISIEPITTPPHIVLLLDSSGSMRAQMEQTLATAREFIRTLSDDTTIQVIDFDTRPKLLEGTSKDEVLASLASVRADGATCLYDSILEGLSLLAGAERPILVVFTDGVDANYDDTGPGSRATLPEVIAAVEEGQIPLYTIGFGPGHDKTVLEQLAEVSTGKYYSAADQDALNQVFQSINTSLSNAFHLVYKRPQKPMLSNVPVVSLMVDTSGSMDSSPQEYDDSNYRMQKVKNVLHDFVLGLPDDTLIQVGSFDWQTQIDQSLTVDKAAVLHAVGTFHAGGATDTVGSINTALRTLRATPSSNKTLIYITDAAIDPKESGGQVNELIMGFANSDIKVIWVGIGLEGQEEIFATIAERSGGRYVVTEDHRVLAAVLEEVLQEVKTPVEERSSVPLKLTVKSPSADGQIILYTDVLDIPYTKLAAGEEVLAPQLYSYYGAGTPAGLEEMEAFGLLSAEQQATGGLTKRFIPLNVSGGNTALKMKVTGATVSDGISGLQAPYGQRFLTIDFILENVLEPVEVEVDARGNSHPASWLGSSGSTGRTEFKVPDYLIPSLPSHLYLGWNNTSMHSVSKSSWIAPNSLLVPGENSLTVRPGELRTGTLVFIVDEEPITQLSLHFYDTAYGHFTMDLIGTNSHAEIAVDSLPKKEPARLSDVFELELRAVSDVTKIGQVKANAGNIFRIVEVDLTSQVQTLLDIDPNEVFSLKLAGVQGDFYLPLHPLTRDVPLGFSEARMVAPGSFNKVRFVYELPQVLADNPCELFVDLRKDDVFIPLSLSQNQPTKPTGTPVRAEGIELYVNQLGWVKKLGGRSRDYVVADLTFVDHADGYGTQLMDAFRLVRDDYEGVDSEVDIVKLVTQGGLGNFTDSGEVFYALSPGVKEAKLLLEFEDGVVKDGLTRRVLLLFEIPPDGLDHSWVLCSGVFPDLRVPLPNAEYSEQELLGLWTTPPFDRWADEFSRRLEATIANAVREHRALLALQGELDQAERMDLTGADDEEISIPPPATTASGVAALEQIDSLNQLLELLQNIRWLPSTDELYQARYAPEAVLTQMWGTEADLAYLAEEVLAKLGYNPQLSMVDLSEEGAEALEERSGVPIRTRQLPAVKYLVAGETNLLVLPFGADFTELTDYVELPWKRERIDRNPLEATINVSFYVVSRPSGIGSQFGDLASVLGGGDDEEELLRHDLLSVNVPLAELSRDAIDLIYMSAGENLYTAVLETPLGRFFSDNPLDGTQYEIRRATIRVTFANHQFTHHFDLREGGSITDVAQTIAINSPDLPQEAAVQLQEIAAVLHRTTEQPDSFSVFRWHTRNIINRFLAAQTEAEQNLAETMDLVIGRTQYPRVIVVTVARDATANKANTSIDLVNAAPEIHTGDWDIHQAYNLAVGLMVSSIEAQALGDGLGVFEIWSYLPEDTPMLLIDGSSNIELAAEVLAELEFDQAIQRKILDTDNVIIFPLDRLIINGEPRTAWLEIDPDTYFAIGRIDTGEHGAMIENAVQNLSKQFTKHSVGAIMGMHTMLWGVSTFALEYAEYKDILAAAVNHSLEIVERVKQSLEKLAEIDPRQVKGILETIDKKGVRAVNDLKGLAKDEAVEHVKAKAEKIPTEKVKELLPDLSFVEGMIDGIELFTIYVSP